MLDPVQIVVSVVGVSLVVALVWLATRRAPPVVLGGEGGLRPWLGREFPGFQAGAIGVDGSDRRALALSEDAREVALIFVMGRRRVGWRFPVNKLRGVEVRDAADGMAVVDIATGDFTRPHFSLEVRDRSLLESLSRSVGRTTPGATS